MIKWFNELKGIRGYFLWLFAGMLLGIIFLYVSIPQKDSFGILSDYYIRQYQYLTIDTEDLFYYILGRRIKWIVLIWIFGFTTAGFPCICTWVFWNGISAGILFLLAVYRFGIAGIGAWILFLFPQSFLYCFSGMFLYSAIYRMKGKRMIKIGNYIFMGCIVFSLYFMGMCMESMISPWLMKQIARIL